MKKQVISCIIAAFMMLTAVWTISAEPVSAAETKPFMNIHADSNGKPRDKVGKYYIWVENSTNGSFLKCAQSLNGKKKTLKKIKGKEAKNSRLELMVFTDGDTIYYAVDNYENTTSGTRQNITVYKTTVKGAKHKKVATIKTYYLMQDLIAYYNGRLYGNEILDNLGSGAGVYTYDISKKTRPLVEGDGYGISSYGQYILIKAWGGPSNGLYNMKTKKFKKLPLENMNQGVIYDKNIYYTEYKEKTDTIIIKKCNLSGKKIKTIKKLKHADIVHLGKKAAYYKTGNSKKIKKVNY